MKNTTKYILLLGLIVMVIMTSCSGPKPLFEVEVENPQVPAKVTFVNKTEDAVDSILWNFGDGNYAKDSVTTHEYLMSGRYLVNLQAKKGGKTGNLQKEIILDPPQKCLVLMKTNMGDMMIELYDATPQHRDNFLKLAEENFLDSLLFHRVIEGFMIQGGDPNSKNAPKGRRLGSGGPGYQIPAEFVDTLLHVKGALAAARTGDQVNPEKKSSGSQFYIVQGKPIKRQKLQAYSFRNGKQYSEEALNTYTTLGGTPQLDWNYTVFGRVIRGLDIVDKIAGVKTDRSDRPLVDVRIEDVIVIK